MSGASAPAGRPASPRRSTFSKKELSVTMALTGIGKIADIDGRVIEGGARRRRRERRPRRGVTESGAEMSERPAPFAIADFPHVADITTRWMDNDVYGHINNVVYYSFFDTVVNDYLIAQGALDITNGATDRPVVETSAIISRRSRFPTRSAPGCACRAISARAACVTRSAFSATTKPLPRRRARSCMSMSTARPTDRCRCRSVEEGVAKTGARLNYRQPSPGATCFNIASMTCAL